MSKTIVEAVCDEAICRCLLDALAKISLAEADSSTSAAEKVRDMARIARRAIAAVDLSNSAKRQVADGNMGHGRS